MLALAFNVDVLNIYWCIRCRVQTRIRYVDVSHTARTLVPEKCTALLGVHAFTGCDSVSAVSGRGKLDGIKLLEDMHLANGLAKSGQEWEQSPELFAVQQEYACRLYAPKVKYIPSQWCLIPAVQSKEGKCWIWPTSTQWRHSVPSCQKG